MPTLKEKTVLLLSIKFPILDFFPSFLGECISKTFLFLSFLNSWQEKWHPLLIIIDLVNKNPTIL